MSDDKEKKIVEETRRSHSDIHSITGNTIKFYRKQGRINDENAVKNPIMALLIIAAAIGIVALLTYLILLIIVKFFSI